MEGLHDSERWVRRAKTSMMKHSNHSSFPLKFKIGSKEPVKVDLHAKFIPDEDNPDLVKKHQLSKEFDAIDQDNDGLINKKDVEKLFNDINQNLTKKDLDIIMNKLSEDDHIPKNNFLKRAMELLEDQLKDRFDSIKDKKADAVVK
jgi:hypothetical protein